MRNTQKADAPSGHPLPTEKQQAAGIAVFPGRSPPERPRQAGGVPETETYAGYEAVRLHAAVSSRRRAAMKASTSASVVSKAHIQRTSPVDGSQS